MKSIKYVAIAYLLVCAMNMNAMFIQFKSVDEIYEKVQECRVINNGLITCTNEPQEGKAVIKEEKKKEQNAMIQNATVVTAASKMVTRSQIKKNQQ